jgi:hypothetical protein
VYFAWQPRDLALGIAPFARVIGASMCADQFLPDKLYTDPVGRPLRIDYAGTLLPFSLLYNASIASSNS